MQILIYSLLIIALIVYVIYKIKKSFTQKEITGFFSLIAVIIVGLIIYNTNNEQKLPQAFKEYYLKEKKIEVLKLSIERVDLEVLSSSKAIYDIAYIIKKDEKEYVCEAKKVEVKKIEDEYIFKNFKDKCEPK